jgi:hypothetical protein
MKNILIVSLVTLLAITGCAENKRCVSSGESRECQKLKHLFNNLEEENIKTILFFAEDSNESVDEATFKEFKDTILYLAGCCFCNPHPLAEEWKEYKRLECIWENLENERVQKIAFARFSALESEFDPPEFRHSPEDQHSWAEIVEPQKINEVLKLLRKALKEGNDKFANEEAILSVSLRDQMQIVTDKHKYIIPVYFKGETTYGIGWTSHELQERLKEWGFHKAK